MLGSFPRAESPINTARASGGRWCVAILCEAPFVKHAGIVKMLADHAEVAELADAPALGAGGRKAVGVRVPSSANHIPIAAYPAAFHSTAGNGSLFLTASTVSATGFGTSAIARWMMEAVSSGEKPSYCRAVRSTPTSWLTGAFLTRRTVLLAVPARSRRVHSLESMLMVRCFWRSVPHQAPCRTRLTAQGPLLRSVSILLCWILNTKPG